MLISSIKPGQTRPAPARGAAKPSISPNDFFSPTPSVGRLTARETLWTTGVAAVSGLAGGLAGLGVAGLGGLAGIPVAIVGETLLGATGMYLLVRDATDGSVIAGNTLVGAGAGAITGTVGSIAGAVGTAITGTALGGVVGGAIGGALVGGGLTAWLALQN
ncbi:MAG: hypothetical protein AB7S38_36660 [Vulcanimicrobiota bacterium]